MILDSQIKNRFYFGINFAFFICEFNTAWIHNAAKVLIKSHLGDLVISREIASVRIEIQMRLQNGFGSIVGI